MKKALSFLLALCLTLSVSMTAFASEKTTSDRVYEQIEGAVEFLTDGVDKYTVDQCKDFLPLIQSGADLDKYIDGFLASVKDNLDRNNGKLITQYGESLADYAAVISVLSECGIDPEDFEGYNLVKPFTALDPANTSFSPNYYHIIIPAAVFYADEAFAKAICDTYVSEYYTMGKGVDYYGFSSDNTAYFIVAMSYYADEYQNVINDAYKVLETYKTDGGYFSNAQYSTEPNADSTALVLMAYSNAVDVPDEELEKYFEKVSSVYNDLCTFESSKTGVFSTDYNEFDSYATKEALMSLTSYYFVALMQELYEEENSTEPSTDKNNPASDNDNKDDGGKTTAADRNSSKKSPATGAGAAYAAASTALLGAGAAVLALSRKKNDIV